jgi:hypothetical protein
MVSTSDLCVTIYYFYVIIQQHNQVGLPYFRSELSKTDSAIKCLCPMLLGCIPACFSDVGLAQVGTGMYRSILDDQINAEMQTTVWIPSCI